MPARRCGTQYPGRCGTETGGGGADVGAGGGALGPPGVVGCSAVGSCHYPVSGSSDATVLPIPLLMGGISGLTSAGILYGQLNSVPAAAAAKFLVNQPVASGGSLEEDGILLSEVQQAGPAFYALASQLGQHLDLTA